MDLNVWQITAAGVLMVLVAILVFRLHAFLALVLSAGLVAALTSDSALVEFAQQQLKLSDTAAQAFAEKHPVERVSAAFGDTTAKVGILIGLASIIGSCLLESGAAAVIVHRILRWVGPRRAPEALAASSFIVGIPVFFDTVFYLMVPLARQLRVMLGRDYTLFVLAIMAGGSIAHSLVPPTPGPLQVAMQLKVPLPTMMLAGCTIGLGSSFLSLLAARALNAWTDVPLRDTTDDSRQVDDANASLNFDQAPAGPPFLLALLPILIPVALIAQQTVVGLWADRLTADAAIGPAVLRVSEFLGEKNLALGIGVLMSLPLLRWSTKRLDRRQVIGQALASGGVVILITAAGGAFGTMLLQAGAARALAAMARDTPGFAILPLAFLVTAAIRTVQGSATVAMITAGSVLQGLASVELLGFHPVYLALAIGAGSKPIAWLTDSGFWLMCKMSGMTEIEGLRTVSLLTVAMGISALLLTMLAAWLVPLV